jgi:hypothetical protein
MSILKPSSLLSRTLASPSPPEPRRTPTPDALAGLSDSVEVSCFPLHPLRSSGFHSNLKISIEPLGIVPGCCQPSVRDISTGIFFVNKKMHR